MASTPESASMAASISARFCPAELSGGSSLGVAAFSAWRVRITVTCANAGSATSDSTATSKKDQRKSLESMASRCEGDDVSSDKKITGAEARHFPPLVVSTQSRRATASCCVKTPAIFVPHLAQRPSFTLFAVTACHERLMITCLHPGQMVLPPSDQMLPS